MLDRGGALRYGPGLFESERLAPALLARGIAHGGGLGDDDGIWTETAQQAGDGAVQARDDGADADHRAGPDNHAEDGEEGSQLVGAHRVECQPDTGEQGSKTHFSALNASIGSSLAARCAG